MLKVCLMCQKEFKTFPCREKRGGRGKYCSRECASKVREGTSPWNKGKVGVMPIPWNKGKEWIERRGENHHLWKGDKVKYVALHQFVNRNKSRENKCGFCGNEGKTQWANLDFEYSRDLDTWKELCQSCHCRYDMKNGWGEGKKAFLERREYGTI